MNVFKKVVFTILLIATSIALLVIGNGHDMYQEALKQMPLNKKIESIETKNNYTKIEEVPEMYINAVISVEDHRFYDHKGIDLVAIRKGYAK